MSRSSRNQSVRGRSTRSASLRALAALLALVLVTGSLGEIAHLLLVPHAICAEHGELVELSSHDEHVEARQLGHAPQADEEHEPGTGRPSEQGASHDHCELLASGQRQLGLPTGNVVALAPPAAAERLCFASRAPAAPALAPLVLAPKTSPPSAAVG